MVGDQSLVLLYMWHRKHMYSNGLQYRQITSAISH